MARSLYDLTTLVAPRYTRSHLPSPDYAGPRPEPSAAQRERLVELLALLYGRERALACLPELLRLMAVYAAFKTPEMAEEDESFDPAERFTEKDVVLITYGDLLVSKGKTPLKALSDFLDVFMRGAINTVHILPFFPYSSDRGFAVTDYEEVDPRLGIWSEIESLSARFRLMFDGVFNHASAQSRWFQRFLAGRPGYENFFVAFNTKDAIDRDHRRLILRPRTSELLTPFRAIDGTRFVWTTFSPDQVDLNFKNERVLLRVIEVLLVYVRRGADLVRLDAVTYIWRELGTRCAHLRQTHALVKLFRAVLDVVAPQVALVTETNVPHEDNVGYFGSGRDEAQLVYNFALPPLVLHTFYTGSCAVLRRWAQRAMPHVSDTASYFNFLDSHDGIGLLGAQGILSTAELEALLERARAHGGLVSYRAAGDGTQSPYELNITWYSALNREDVGEPQELQVERYLASRAIAFVLRGVPGVYLPGVFGAKNDTATVLSGAEARSINRKTIDEAALFQLLAQRGSWVHEVATRFRRMAKRRVRLRAFHPNAEQTILDVGEGVFAVLRVARDGRERVLALTNVSARQQHVRLSTAELGAAPPSWYDALSGREVAGGPDGIELALKPYGVLWLGTRSFREI